MKNDFVGNEIFDVQNAVIKLQSDVIYELLTLLLQHVSSDELDNLPITNKINLAAELRNGLDDKI